MRIKAVAHIIFEMEVSDSTSPAEIRAYFSDKQYCDGDTTIVDKLYQYHKMMKAEGKCICDTTIVEYLPTIELLQSCH